MIPLGILGSAAPRSDAPLPSGVVVASMNPAAPDGATSYVDARGHTYTRAGSAVVADGVPGFGGACMSLGGGSETFTAPDSADFDLLSSGVDFSVEALVRFLTAPPGGTGATLVSRGSDSDANWQLRASNAGLEWVFPGQEQISLPFSFSTGQTYHVYYGRSGVGGGTMNYLAVDGAIFAVAGVGRTTDSPGVLRLGRASYGAPLHGYLAHRITSGACKWKDHFSPPSGPLIAT